MELSCQVKNLQAVLPQLNERDRGFAKSLCDQYAQRGSLSPKQVEWVGVMYQRSQPKQDMPVGDLSGLVALMQGSRVKRPAVLVRVNGQDLRLSVAGQSAKVPGSINVCSTGSFANRDWYGRVTQEGAFQPSSRFSGETLTAVAAALAALAQNPAGAAAAYGQVTGVCCFCGLTLTDPRSVTVGYGPICAGNYGLPWGEG